MRLYEFITDDDLSTARYDPEQDEVNKRKITDNRKETLTLKDLAKLKKIRAFNKLEALKAEDLYAVLYAQPEADSGGGGMGGF